MFVKGKVFDWEAIRAYYDAGHSVRECRERFGFSNHAWDAAVKRGDVEPRHGWSGRPRGETRQVVRALIEQGLSFAEIARQLNLSKPTITYHAHARTDSASRGRALARPSNGAPSSRALKQLR
jgi:transposase